MCGTTIESHACMWKHMRNILYTLASSFRNMDMWRCTEDTYVRTCISLLYVFGTYTQCSTVSSIVSSSDGYRSRSIWIDMYDGRCSCTYTLHLHTFSSLVVARAYGLTTSHTWLASLFVFSFFSSLEKKWKTCFWSVGHGRFGVRGVRCGCLGTQSHTHTSHVRL